MKRESKWEKTRYANLVRFASSGVYFIRARVHDKLIRESLGTDVETVAKSKLDARLREERNKGKVTAASKMKMASAIEVFKQRVESEISPKTKRMLKPLAKVYKKDTLAALIRSWETLPLEEVRRISQKECEAWAAKYRADYGSTRYNGTLGVLRSLFDIAIEQGAIATNPAKSIHRLGVSNVQRPLPSAAQFRAILKIMDERESYSPGAANLVRLLAFSGMRKSEARNLLWAHVDFEKSRLQVLGDPIYGTKNSERRTIPMIEDMREFLSKLPKGEPADRVASVNECRYSLAKACELAEAPRITHHDLRHLFATRCIEAGVDIPTVSRWLGHKDGGALAMKRYGHLRDEHSASMAQKVRFA